MGPKREMSIHLFKTYTYILGQQSYADCLRHAYAALLTCSFVDKEREIPKIPWHYPYGPHIRVNYSLKQHRFDIEKISYILKLIRCGTIIHHILRWLQDLNPNTLGKSIKICTILFTHS